MIETEASFCLLALLLLAAAFCDLRTYRIPNKLILCGVALGVWQRVVLAFVRGFAWGQVIKDLLGALFLAAAMLCLLLPLWKLRAFGGGDVKLLCVCVLFIGFQRTVNSLIYALFFGAATALSHLCLSHFFPKHLKALPSRGNMHIIHFTLPILLGVATEYFFGGIWQCFGP